MVDGSKDLTVVIDGSETGDTFYETDNYLKINEIHSIYLVLMLNMT